VLAIEPTGDYGGDEELGQEEGLVVRELEVLVGELVTVDGLSETEASAIGLM